MRRDGGGFSSRSFGCAPATTAPATQPADPAWAEISKVLEHPGVTKEGVYVVTIPRDDLDVTIGGMGIPTAAGIESVFYFYRCPCGKMNVAGQFVTVDYESNDVVDALRQNAIMRVASIAPMLQYENPPPGDCPFSGRRRRGGHGKAHSRSDAMDGPRADGAGEIGHRNAGNPTGESKAAITSRLAATRGGGLDFARA